MQRSELFIHYRALDMEKAINSVTLPRIRFGEGDQQRYTVASKLDRLLRLIENRLKRIRNSMLDCQNCLWEFHYCNSQDWLVKLNPLLHYRRRFLLKRQRFGSIKV